jgi:hypothetical protein
MPAMPMTVSVLYQYKGTPNVYSGLVAYLTPEYRWLLDIPILEGDVDQEWVEFDKSILHYIDLALGDTMEELMSPDNPYEYYVLCTDINTHAPHTSPGVAVHQMI